MPFFQMDFVWLRGRVVFQSLEQIEKLDVSCRGEVTGKGCGTSSPISNIILLTNDLQVGETCLSKFHFQMLTVLD
jgi:hypothetical protein